MRQEAPPHRLHPGLVVRPLRADGAQRLSEHATGRDGQGDASGRPRFHPYPGWHVPCTLIWPPERLRAHNPRSIPACVVDRACDRVAHPPHPWVRDLHEEGVEPHPGPCVLSQNVDGLSARLDAVLWKIKGLHQTKPLLAVFFQEHHLHRARAAGINATQKARNLGFHLILNPPPDNERKGGTAILIPYDQIEIKKDEHGLDAAVARVNATVKKSQDGRFTSCDVTLNGSTIRLATAYAPQSAPQRVQFLKTLSR